jgi:hypothetical protein
MAIIKAPAKNNLARHLPKFMVRRASNAYWTGMPNSVMILFPSPWLPPCFANFSGKMQTF